MMTQEDAVRAATAIMGGDEITSEEQPEMYASRYWLGWKTKLAFGHTWEEALKCFASNFAHLKLERYRSDEVGT